MSRLFDVIRGLSGQNAISIQRPYIRLCGDHTQAAVLSQLVFWSSKTTEGQLFYKSNKELGEELEIAPHKVRYALDQIKKKFPDVISVVRKKAHGVPTNHYKLDSDKLVALLFPPEEPGDSGVSNGFENIVKPICEDSQTPGFENIVKPINRSEPYTNKQILPPNPLEGEKSGEAKSIPEPKSKSKKISVPDLDFSVMGEITPEQIQMILRIRKSKRANVTQNVLNQLAKQFGLAARNNGLSLQECLDEWEYRGWQAFKAEWLSKPGKGLSLSELNDDTSWIDGMDLDELGFNGG